MTKPGGFRFCALGGLEPQRQKPGSPAGRATWTGRGPATPAPAATCPGSSARPPGRPVEELPTRSGPSQLTDVRSNNRGCLKALSFGVICFAATENRNRVLRIFSSLTGYLCNFRGYAGNVWDASLSTSWLTSLFCFSLFLLFSWSHLSRCEVASPPGFGLHSPDDC